MTLTWPPYLLISPLTAFWLSETLSYLYMLFEDQEKVPKLDQWVFNTEGHPLPIFVPSEPTSFD